MKYHFINEHRSQHAISLMCRLLRVPRAGVYAWLHDLASIHEHDDRRLLKLIRHSLTPGHGVYGAIRAFADLREAVERCGKHLVARIMRKQKTKAIWGYKTPGTFQASLPSLPPTTCIGSSPRMPQTKRASLISPCILGLWWLAPAGAVRTSGEAKETRCCDDRLNPPSTAAMTSSVSAEPMA